MLSSFNFSKLNAYYRKFSRDRRGNVFVMFALTAPILMLGMAGSFDYARTAVYERQLKIAADAAALAATEAMVAGQSTSAAETVGLNMFQGNVVNFSWQTNALNVNTGSVNGLYTTSVTYQTTFPTVFSSILGAAAIPVSVNSTAQAATGASGGSNGILSYAGVGGIWGDPHVDGADGSSWMFTGCVTTPPSWYNALSDSGIEINVTCLMNNYWNQEGVSGISISLKDSAGATHVISTNAVMPTYPTDANGNLIDNPNYNGQGWVGGLTIDGVYYTPVLGNHSYLKGMVQTAINDVADPSQEDNYVNIAYTNGKTSYAITINYDPWQQAAITITATNAGACGTPGGIWGYTLAGLDNLQSIFNYEVSGPTATATEFRWGTCSAANVVSATPHLVK